MSTRITVLVVLLGGVLASWVFCSRVAWQAPVEVSRLPCLLKPGTHVVFLRPSHGSLRGVVLERVADRARRRVSLELFTVPGETLLVSTRVSVTREALEARFRPMEVPPGATLKARLSLSGDAVVLRCVAEGEGPARRERPVVHALYALGPTIPSSCAAWLHQRVEPLLPPRMAQCAARSLLAVPLLGAAAIAVVGFALGRMASREGA